MSDGIEPASLFAWLGGAGGLATLAWNAISWSFKRNLKAEEDARAEEKKRLEALEKKTETQFDALEKRIDEKFDEVDDTLTELDKNYARLDSTITGNTSALDQLRGTLNELMRSLEVTRDKQTQAWRESMKELEQTLRSEIERGRRGARR